MAPRILVVDDDAGLRRLMRLVLHQEGFDVIEAADGSEALARAHDSDPTLVLLDVMMPDMDGFDVCRRLRSDQRTQRLPIVLVSARDDAKQRNEAWRLGADDCLGKPVSSGELIKRLRGVMERRGIAHAT